jgi:phosphatidate cytidylyltransferase
MVRRTITALLLLGVVVPAVYFGGLIYFLPVGIFIALSAWEYVRLFRRAGYAPSAVLVLSGATAIVAARAYWPAGSGLVLAALILAAMTVHLLAYDRGRDAAALDFGITVAGVAYFGWIAAYIIDLRNLPAGGWWTMLVFGAVWLADSGAYLIGVKYGRHKMLKRLSPGKSWEGWAAGVVGGTLSGGFLAFAFSTFIRAPISIAHGLLVGFVLSAATILGDLGESLFKRFAAAKDSGDILPGHGGAFDRIDSLIWAGVLGYYLIYILIR